MDMKNNETNCVIMAISVIIGGEGWNNENNDCFISDIIVLSVMMQ
jgi:hypothetical protein